MLNNLKFVILLILWQRCDSTYFEDQPKLLTENGNFVIESAVDKNISFRLKGRSFVNINDVNLMDASMTWLRSGSFNQSNVPNSNLALRLTDLENQFRQTPLRRIPALARRVNALERGSNISTNWNFTAISRRVRSLEVKVNRLIAQLNADNCTSDPCQHGGECINTFNGFSCKCPNEWTGPICSIDVNECNIYANTDLGCQNSISCENTPGGYNCRCKPGWQGIHCTKRTVDCLSSSSYELCGHGVCVPSNDPTSYKCICDQGWISNGTSPACTVDVNECESSKPQCSKDPEVQCINLPGSYTCGTCPHGFTGNGHYCKDIDECAENNGGCSQAPLVPCINTRGSSKCGPCPFGYSGDGRVCIRTNTPIAPGIPGYVRPQCETPNICHQLATCIPLVFSVACVCPRHYSGNGIGPLGCVPSNSTFDACSANPCLNGGTCVGLGLFGFRCECPEGTMQPRCDQSINACSPNPCTNGGTCSLTQFNRFTSFRCTCPPGRAGRLCSAEVPACGGVRNAFNGTLKYPLSNNYPHNSRCAWLIKTDDAKVLNVTFSKFNLETSLECRFDWLQIHDGRSSSSYMIGRFCGAVLPKNGNIISTQNMLYLWFRSDNSSAHDGFELTWNSIDPVCGGDINIESHGTIASPGSPGNYPPNRDCIWKLRAAPSKRIQLHFFTMQLETHESCQNDYLSIYSGLSTDGDLLEKFCNTTHPEPLLSPSNELTLQFHSDADGTDAGFQIHYSLVEGMQGCGGTFTAKSGEFGSPVQNGEYPKNIECHYLIKLARKNETRVKIHFTSFNLESSPSCHFDYVEIYEGRDVNAPKVGRWCGNQSPPDYSSQSNELLLVFRTDFSNGAEGFRLTYETDCGGKYEDDNGVIMSPWFPNPYEDNKKCAYDIEAPLGKAIVLNFTNFDIEDECDFDSLNIYDGVDKRATKIGTYCGNEKPPVAISTMNHMHLSFETDSSNTGSGFKAYYSFIDASCGGIIKKPNITITPPSGQNGYEHSSSCKWVIVAPPGFIVELTFDSFDLEDYPECPYDSVSIYDSVVIDEHSATPIGKYCGTEKPPVLMSSSSELTISFKSDSSVNGQGFAARYSFINGRNLCGGNFHALTGNFTSPNFPQEYPQNQDCVYVINAPNGKQIQLNVEEFALEGGNNNCPFDFLEIRNGATDKSPLLGTFCGNDILPRFKSFSNHLYLRFKSDSSNERKGFKISYDTSISGCGGTFSGALTGTLTSPNYPNTYPANMQCDYRIHVSRGSLITLLVTDLSMESTSDCYFDSISIYDGPNSASKLLGTYCQSENLIQIESTSNTLFVRMISDVSNQGRGFEMNFRTNCKRTIHDLRGAIESPNFPGNYPHNADCEWRLVPPIGNRIFLEFSHLDMEHSWSMDYGDSRGPHCNFDHVTIEEHDNSDSVIRTDKYCEHLPKPFNTSNTLVIIFKSDFSNAASGFHLEYEMQGCGGILTKPEGSFTSPNYPNPYPRNVHCQWEISVDYGHLIEINLTDFDFEASTNCEQDGLIIANDKNAIKVISKFCGSRNIEKPTVTSSRNTVYVNFFADVSITGKGFSATYKSIPAKCGGTFSLPQGTITSPNYPNNYDPNSNCQWLLRTERSHSISFQFTDFDLVETCSMDSVRIYDGAEKKQDKLILEACGDQSGNGTSNQTRIGFNKPLKSTGNEMLVVMETDDSIASKGFSAQYGTACGSKITTSSNGILEIGHNLRWIADDCEWVISANDSSQHVSLTIMHLENEPVYKNSIARFSNETLEDCVKTIFVYDGTSTSSPKITEICSNKHPPPIISEGSSLTLSFSGKKSDEEINYAWLFDLKAYYSVIDNECGGDFTSVAGQIASPGYPKTYKNNIECEWTIKASPGNEMTISIDMIDIDETEHCNGDYLEIREDNSAGYLIDIFCGKTIPPTLPHANNYWLKFRSDNDGVGRGFLLEYKYATIVEQTGKSGVITSMMYPSYMYSSVDPHKWRITVSPDQLIRVAIDNCILKRDGSIQIFDGYDSSSDSLSTFKSDDIPTESILSSSNIILVVFEISTFSESKFKLVWNEVPSSAAISNVTNDLNCSANSIINVDEADNLKIQSPGYPTGYDGNLNCLWTFIPPPGYHVSASFLAIDLESTENCIADYVRVETGSDIQRMEKKPNMCTMDQITRNSRFHGSPNLKIAFQSDYVTNKTGFEAVVMLDCGGPMAGPQGEISDKMTKSKHSNFWMNSTCTWPIIVQRGRTIKFKFDNLDMRKNDDGSCGSYIIIRNGIHDDSPFLGDGKYCGGIASIPISSSNKVFVQYVKGRPSRDSDTFLLKYEQVEYECGAYVTLNYGNNNSIISSPNYPNIPAPHSECIWRISARNGDLLKIEFLERFDLTSSAGCTNEYVEIREGSTSTAPVLGKFCASKPQPIYSSTNMLRVKYFTDVLVPRNGFQLKVSLARCGKAVAAMNGYINSPGYPGKGAYPMQAECDYHITGRMGTVLNITFVDLDLPHAFNCSEVDHIIIFSIVRSASGNTSLTEVQKVCGSHALPEPILTFSSKAVVRFVTKSSNNQYTGFRFKFESTIDSCGARIEATTGIIQSPGYPVGQDRTKLCEWMIQVPKGRRVKIEVLDFDFAPASFSIRISESRITFYNDFFFMSQIYSLTATNRSMAPIYSTDNTMGVSTLIRSNLGHRGFKLRFTSDEATICDGNLNENEGSFQSPENITRFHCEFARESHEPFFEDRPNQGTLSIKILQDNRFNNGTECVMNTATGIAAGYRENERQSFYTKCPPTYENIVSPYQDTKLSVRSNPLYKYRFPYKIHSCGGIMTESVTNISIPTLPSNYGELDCAWLYSTTDRRIQLSVTVPAMNCDTEYLSIYRGRFSNRARVERFCGDAVRNRTVTIRSPQTFISYHSANYNPSLNFQIEIVTYDGVCGGNINAPNYIFSSPKNGTKYPANTECEWIIRAQNGFHIGLTFPSRFMFEQSTNCEKDYVKVFDKIDGEFHEISKLCGREPPEYLNSTGREMKVLFHTDGNGDGDGFTAAWEENCGGTFKATSQPQFITSPRFPDPYPINLFCKYSIVGESSQSVSVNFLHFDLEASNNLCRYDNVTIYRPTTYMEEVRMEEVGTYCQNNSISFFRYTERIDVVFRTDAVIALSGFKFEYNTDKCGGNITEPQQIGSLHENGDEMYLPSATCVWFITAPSDKTILVRFEQFDLEHNSGCYSDYVDVYNGHATDDKQRKARLCGNLTEHAPSVSIESNKAIVEFNTDATNNEKGFTALIMFVKKCSERIQLTSDRPKQTLNKLSAQYEPLLNCEYFITAPVGYVIQAKFSQLHLDVCENGANNNSCTCDYLNIRDGSGPFSESFGSFCGHTNPPDMITTTGNLYMRFVTDSVGFSTGFSVDLEMIVSPCGPSIYNSINNTKITIENPIGASTYSPNLNCLWKFSTDYDDLIDIKFEKFDLEDDPDNKCTADFVEITEEEPRTTISEGLGENTIFSGNSRGKNKYFFWGKQWPTETHRYCGNGLPIDYLSSTVFVRFKSNDLIEKSGFKFTAQSLPDCARNYTKAQGRLYSRSKVDCETYINVPENYTITLYFTSVDFNYEGDCSGNNIPLKVYNARNDEVLESYCGDSRPKPLFTTTNSLKLKFNGHHMTNGMEFYDITYLATDKGRGCGGELYSYGGTLASPGYPNTDRNNSDCTWTINVPMNLLVAVQFGVFDMGSKATCELNYVELIESDESIPSTKFCGTDSPAPYRSRSNQLKIHFKNSLNFAGTGWVVNFMAVHEHSDLNQFM